MFLPPAKNIKFAIFLEYQNAPSLFSVYHNYFIFPKNNSQVFVDQDWGENEYMSSKKWQKKKTRYISEVLGVFVFQKCWKFCYVSLEHEKFSINISIRQDFNHFFPLNISIPYQLLKILKFAWCKSKYIFCVLNKNNEKNKGENVQIVTQMSRCGKYERLTSQGILMN